ncbi:MAG: M28 family peptidase [Acutalibacteraceae bacterium]
MKASQSVPNFQSKLRENTNFAVREIKHICSEIGPRASGYENERKAQEYTAQKLREFSDTVEIEDFSVSTKAFMAWVVIDGVLLLTGTALSFFRLYALSLVCLFIALFLLVGEFVMYKKVLDPFFKKYTSCNVVAKRAPKGEIKRRVIISGHMDSSFEWTYTHLGGASLVKGVIIYTVIGVVYLLVINVLGLIFPNSGFLDIMGYVLLAFVPAFTAILFFTNFKKVVDGANDNLSGAYTAVACMKFLSDNAIRFENTEVIALTTGSEEAGLRGAKYYFEKHLDECKAVPTVFFAFDTVRDYDHMAIYSRDLSGTVKHDEKACAILKKATEEAELSDIPFSSVYLGASDAAAATQAGIPAAAFAAMDLAPARYYHTRDDRAEILQPKTIEKGIFVALSAIFEFDANEFARNN